MIAPANREAIRTEGLTKEFGSTVALNGLDLEVERGTVFGFLGPNGAGKTTLIRLLLDLIRPTRGTARVLGFDAGRQSLEVRRRCGYLPGELKLPPHGTAEQFLAHMVRLRGDADWRRIYGLAEMLELDLDRSAAEQSKGNRQKPVLLSAFMFDPELLILAEPTSGLDPIRQQVVRGLIRERVAGGGTVLLSSHDLDQVEHVADRVGIIREGNLVALEDIASLRAKAVREVSVTFDGPVPELGGIPGVEIVSAPDEVLRLRVAGPMDPLVKELSRSKVVSLTSAKPDLDQIFLSYYGGGDDA